MRTLVLAVFGGAFLVLTSCSQGGPDPHVTTLTEPPASLTVSGGDAQVAAPGAAVAIPPAVVVTDRFGNPVANVPVSFAVTSGGGVAWCPSATTDTLGIASCALWTLGMARGPNTLSATVSGLAPVVFTAAVRAEVLLDLGHGDPVVQLLRMNGTRLLSRDRTGHWVLWDVTGCARIASGDHPPCASQSGSECTPSTADLAGPTLLIAFPSGVEARDASDGRVLSRILGNHAWTRLASDGSHVYAGTTTELSWWTLDGRLVLSRAGDYSRAKTFADRTTLRVAGGPAGENVIETIDPSTGTSSVGAAFEGTFHSWFTDGQRFFTNQSTTVWVYSSAGAKEAIFSLPTIQNLGGQGMWLWTYGQYHEPLAVYRVDGGGIPAATYTDHDGGTLSPTTNGIAFFTDSGAAVIDLSGAAPSRTDYASASGSLISATSSAVWFVATRDGVIRVLDGANLTASPRLCGLGTAWSIAGGGDRVAVATASGKILYFGAATSAFEGEITFTSSKLQLSSDGTVLAAADVRYESALLLKIFSLPAGTEVRSWPFESPPLLDFSLSASGTLLGQVLGASTYASSSCDRRVSPILGGTPTWTVPTSGCEGTPILLSPAGNRVAFGAATSWPDAVDVTNLYQDGALVSAVAGMGVGWLDDGRLLVNKYGPSEIRPSNRVYKGAAIHDAAGVLLATPALPELRSIQPVTPTSVYSPDRNAIFSLETGAALWTGPPESRRGAVAGGRVVYRSGPYVLSEPY